MRSFIGKFKFLPFGNRPEEDTLAPHENEIKRISENANFSFREGFPERVTARLERIIELNPENIFYKNLSVLLPKIAGFSFASLIIMIIVLFSLHGSLNPEKLMGADRVDETNFITYLIMED